MQLWQRIGGVVAVGLVGLVGVVGGLVAWGGPLNDLRPVVRCMTRRYNHRVRLGRGFSLKELEACKLKPA